MFFKLDDNAQKDALKLDGTRIGGHHYAPVKLIKVWISELFKYSEKWIIYAKNAVKLVKLLEK